MKRTISTTDTAKMIRKALKDAFADIKFSVRSDKYAGGSSIRVTWTDGPTLREVRSITDGFEGAEFDGMIDMKSYKSTMLDGQEVHFAADYVFTDRDHSTAALVAAAQSVIDFWGWEEVTAEDVVAAYTTGKTWELSQSRFGDGQCLNREMNDALELRDRYEPKDAEDTESAVVVQEVDAVVDKNHAVIVNTCQYPVNKEFKAVFGDHYCGSDVLEWGQDTIIAKYDNPEGGDGQPVTVVCCATPTRFYTIQAAANTNSVGTMQPAFTLQTGGVSAEFARDIAKSIADGMLGIVTK